MCSSPPFLVTLSSSWSSIRASPQRHKALKRPQSIQAPDPQARNPFLLAADLLKPLSQSAHQAWCHPIGIQERDLKLRYIPQAQSSPQGPADSKRSTDDCAAFYINTDTRIQILDSMDHLPQAEKEQCDAFLRDERMLRLVGRILFPSSRLQGDAHEAQLAPQQPPLQPTPRNKVQMVVYLNGFKYWYWLKEERLGSTGVHLRKIIRFLVHVFQGTT
ncbi:hypothetical protein C8J57DRAFT_1481226 [Mycena rebaudengoi]|nr:hypothetical protein C8J57DRAFT_1481226 [Mycena rebaudengoi]